MLLVPVWPLEGEIKLATGFHLDIKPLINILDVSIQPVHYLPDAPFVSVLFSRQECYGDWFKCFTDVWVELFCFSLI